MSYYIIPDVEDPDREIDGPYRNKDEVIEALSVIANAGVFDTKTEARKYIKNFIGSEY